MWMSGASHLTKEIKEIIHARNLPTDLVAYKILQLYMTHPREILVNTQDEVVRWFDSVQRQYAELMK